MTGTSGVASPAWTAAASTTESTRPSAAWTSATTTAAKASAAEAASSSGSAPTWLHSAAAEAGKGGAISGAQAPFPSAQLIHTGAGEHIFLRNLLHAAADTS